MEFYLSILKSEKRKREKNPQKHGLFFDKINHFVVQLLSHHHRHKLIQLLDDKKYKTF